jgi:hypothetical protein
MNYQHSIVQHEPYGEATSSPHGIVYPLLTYSRISKMKIVPLFPWKISLALEGVS